MDGHQKIATLAIVVSVSLLFHACSVEQPVGVHLFQPNQAETTTTGPVATGPAIKGPVVTDSVVTDSVATDSVVTDASMTVTTLSEFSDSTRVSLPRKTPDSSEIRSMEHSSGTQEKDLLVDTIVHAEAGPKMDSPGHGEIASGAGVAASRTGKITTSASQQINAEQDTIIRLLNTLVRSIDSLRQAESRNSFDTLKWRERSDYTPVQDMPGKGLIASDNLYPGDRNTRYFDAGDTVYQGDTDSLEFISENNLAPDGSEFPMTRETNQEVLVMPAKDVDAIIRSLASENETRLRALQQQAQDNNRMLRILETELKELRNAIEVQAGLRMIENTTYAYAGSRDGIPRDTNLRQNSTDSPDKSVDAMDITGPGNQVSRIESSGSNDSPASVDSLSDPLDMITLQMKHYEEVRILQDSMHQLERKNAQLIQQVNRRIEEPAEEKPEPVSDSVYSDRMVALKSGYERMLINKTDSIAMLKNEISGMVHDATEEVSFVVYYESSSLNGKNREEFERKLDLLPLTDLTAVFLSAFADQSGTEEANYYISEQRMNVLTKELTGRGISPLIIYRQNNGEKFASGSADPKDRRVEILFRF